MDNGVISYPNIVKVLRLVELPEKLFIFFKSTFIEVEFRCGRFFDFDVAGDVAAIILL